MIESLHLEQDNIYTVSRLNNEVRFLLEDTWAAVWVEGEISNFAAPHSGHFYFSLKDASAQVRCAMFRNSQKKLNFTPKDGAQVLVKARASLYENRGEFQLIVEYMEERGEGKLRRAYEALKKKLEAAGLFDAAHKKKLPLFPQTIGVITSATGAAIRDILTVLKRRYACTPIIIYPTLVQGQLAAENIVSAIKIANRRKECDVLILARGGGSLEDLWPFNEEMVAQAIYQSELPIISGVGHEVDFTIADYVADLRAPTPSAAAEIVSPDCTELLQTLLQCQQQIMRFILRQLHHFKKNLDWTQKHLAQHHPKRQLLEKMQFIDICAKDLVTLQNNILHQLKIRLQHLQHKLLQQSPLSSIQQLQNQTHLAQQSLQNIIKTDLSKQRTLLANAAATLDALSPLATLQRGFAIATTNQQHIIQDANQVMIGEKINVRLHHGNLECLVEKVSN